MGDLILAGNEDGLAGLWIDGQKYFAELKTPSNKKEEEIIEDSSQQIFVDTKKWVDSYFSGEKPPISQLKLAPKGTAFRQAVWDILCGIPYGETTTYGEIAKQMAKKMNRPTMSSQAVGGAVGHNPISIIIPCHRVVGTNGSLTGYAGGIDKKVKLLEHEGVDLSDFFMP